LDSHFDFFHHFSITETGFVVKKVECATRMSLSSQVKSWCQYTLGGGELNNYYFLSRLTNLIFYVKRDFGDRAKFIIILIIISHLFLKILVKTLNPDVLEKI